MNSNRDLGNRESTNRTTLIEAISAWWRGRRTQPDARAPATEPDPEAVPADILAPATSGSPLPQFLAAEDVNDVGLMRILDQAFLSYSIDAGGNVQAVGPQGIRIALIPNSYTQWLHFAAFWRPKADAPRERVQELAARINESVTVVRAALDHDGDLMFDYYLPYVAGLSPKALVRALFTFESVLRGAMAQLDTENLF